MRHCTQVQRLSARKREVALERGTVSSGNVIKNCQTWDKSIERQDYSNRFICAPVEIYQVIAKFILFDNKYISVATSAAEQ